MEKTGVLASLGQNRLLLPIRVKAALHANDQIKLLLTLLQCACADSSDSANIPDFSRELASAGLDQPWLRDLPAKASRLDNRSHIPELPQVSELLQSALQTMARPLLTTAADASSGTDTDSATDSATDTETGAATDFSSRYEHWQQVLQQLTDDSLDSGQLDALTHGRRERGDSLHLLVMDLHRALNQLAAGLASENIDGAHVWQIDAGDRPRIRAFMAGLNRTAPLKFNHPGLDTAVTRDGDKLLIQNDIGTNDAHVLVLQVCERRISLTYSDLHPRRFAFFQTLLGAAGAVWSQPQTRTTRGLNQNDAYTLGTATFNSDSDAGLDQTLATIAAQIVFLIDWNKARKRLKTFVSNPGASAILTRAARQQWGHRAWLEAGAEQLIYGAMQAAGAGIFRIGDRLDQVLGAATAADFIAETLHIASAGMLQGRPAAIIAEEVQLLLQRLVRRQRCEFDLLLEHAAYCHALAQAVHDSLLHGLDDSASAAALTAKAKAWERRADHLVIEARQLGQRQPHWLRFVQLLEQADDISDALEEAAFLLSLHAQQGERWSPALRAHITRISACVLSATQEHVKSIAIARDLHSDTAASDSSAFLACSWQILRAERQCDELLRAAKRCLLADPSAPALPAPVLLLANDLINVLEQASDHLLSCNHPLRALVLSGADTAI